MEGREAGRVQLSVGKLVHRTEDGAVEQGTLHCPEWREFGHFNPTSRGIYDLSTSLLRISPTRLRSPSLHHGQLFPFKFSELTLDVLVLVPLDPNDRHGGSTYLTKASPLNGLQDGLRRAHHRLLQGRGGNLPVPPSLPVPPATLASC